MVMAHHDFDGDETLEPFDTDDLTPLEVPAAAAAAINSHGLFPKNVSACLVTTPHDQKDKETLREYKWVVAPKLCRTVHVTPASAPTRPSR